MHLRFMLIQQNIVKTMPCIPMSLEKDIVLIYFNYLCIVMGLVVTSLV